MGLESRSYNHLIIEGYQPADVDGDGTPNFYGFVRADGQWYIQRETLSPGADVYEFAMGADDYLTNWTNRASLAYVRFHQLAW